MEGCRAWLANELTPRRDLLLLKTVICLHVLGMYSALPFVRLYILQQGITYKEMATIALFLPIPALLGPAISGLVADRTGRYKLVLCVVTLLTAFMSLLLLFVPSRPSRTLTFTCHSRGHTLTWSSCDLCHDDRANTSLELSLQNCKYLCDSALSELHMCFTADYDNTCVAFNLGDEVKLNGTMMSVVEGNSCSHTWSEVEHEGQVFRGLTCPVLCPVHCQVSAPPRCSDPRDPANNVVTFWVYFAIRIVWYFFMIASFTMLDATTLAVIKQHDGEFGKQKVPALIATAIAPPISGALVDWWSVGQDESQYAVAFWICFLLVVPAGLLVTRLDFTVERPKNPMLVDLRRLVTKVKVDAFLILVFVLGTNWGFVESYLFPYLKDLNASNTLMGLTMTVASITSLPIIFFSDKIINKLGYLAIFGIAFFSYFVREFCYSFIKNPWLAMPLEMIEVFSQNLPWIAMTCLCPVLAPKGLLATMTGILSPVHHAFGRASGASLGGLLVSAQGLAGAYRTFSYITLGCGAVYLVLCVTYLIGWGNRKDKEGLVSGGLNKVEASKPRPLGGSGHDVSSELL